MGALPELRPHRTAPVRPGGHRLRAPPDVRARMIQVVEAATEAVLDELPRAGMRRLTPPWSGPARPFPVGPRCRRANELRCFMRSPTRWRTAGELAVLEARNVGKPIADARGEMGMVANLPLLRRRPSCSATRSLFGRPAVHGPRAARRGRADHALELPAHDPRGSSRRRSRPATPSCSSRRAHAATALRFASWRSEAGIPDGVVNVVTGPGERAGQRRRAPGCREDRLHGLDRGRPLIAARAAATIKRVTLELGRHEPQHGVRRPGLSRSPATSPIPSSTTPRPGLLRRSRILVQRPCTTASGRARARGRVDPGGRSA